VQIVTFVLFSQESLTKKYMITAFFSQEFLTTKLLRQKKQSNSGGKKAWAKGVLLVWF